MVAPWIDAGAHADQFDLDLVGCVDQLTWSMSNAVRVVNSSAKGIIVCADWLTIGR